MFNIIKMKNKFVVLFVLFFTIMNIHFNSGAQIQFGVFADCQYCDCETTGTRFYRNSPEKLDKCIAQFNQNEKLDFVVGLGDLIDRNFASFNKVNNILSRSEKDVFQVIGNHDLEVEKELLDKVPGKLNLNKTWYSFKKKGWLFIFLDGNDISFHSTNKKTLKKAEKMSEKLKKEGKPNYNNWNGGIGRDQLNWLKKQLTQASTENSNVAVFCHYPLLPFEGHALWNSDEVLAIFKKTGTVKLFMNGHNHKGNYAFSGGTHFVNLKGMVETETENAFAEVYLSENEIQIKGFGREKDQVLPIQ